MKKRYPHLNLQALCHDLIIDIILRHIDTRRKTIRDWLMPVEKWVKVFGLVELGAWINQLPGRKAQDVLIRAIDRSEIRYQKM